MNEWMNENVLVMCKRESVLQTKQTQALHKYAHTHTLAQTNKQTTKEKKIRNTNVNGMK